ncbi:5-carboxymethyl-2-hydroxymuconate isomerase [Streptomyces sp. DSM 42143]|uniref:5-carboxymethyl-2-hydroxymuconate Delta-isomerase n=1 Tax=Streptomyces sp. DSM 42143 TaxID=2817711 RepID=UPI002787AA79|nr:5-carboxymethyl-2-hydroxymuconate delta isomerase [Streptomyces sp. DSM 42143]MDQ0383193.1 5-carboxymethyl-2-hydroxymuconate isomerase [Streptomyces sp. DSM 42143]
MPHITVDYPRRLASLFDLRAFTDELHPMVLDGSSSAGTCKTLFREATTAYVSHQHSSEAAFVHVEVGLLPGRPDGLKARLSQAILGLLERHIRMATTDNVVCSVEVRDLADSYRLRTL